MESQNQHNQQPPQYGVASASPPQPTTPESEAKPRYQEQPQQPQQSPMQYQQGQMPQSQQHETPLVSLNKTPVLVRCPRCEQAGITRIEYESGGSTHGLAFLLCICCCLGCIPYMASSLKDVVHYCGNCNGPLATWHRSGRTEVHAKPPQRDQPGQQPLTGKFQ